MTDINDPKIRIKRLNTRPVQKGRYVLYWMQQSQRAVDNPALEFTIKRANELKVPVLVGFGLTDAYPQANLRHYHFMLEGLKETEKALELRGIQLLIKKGVPDDVALLLAREACLVVCDRGYLRHQKAWRNRVAQQAGCAVFQVEGDVIVPLEMVSNKTEWAARTLRPKLNRLLDVHLKQPAAEKVRFSSINLADSELNLESIEKVCRGLRLDRNVEPVPGFFKGGTSWAKKKIGQFLKQKCANYDKHHNQPQTDDTSLMSPYLHFGQISPRYLAIKIKSAKGLPVSAKDAYLEQLIVRRELAMNYVNFQPVYDQYEGIPAWARQTLREHQGDERPVVYDLAALENAQTHDPYWNAAMREMSVSGYMHNYMRMYWGKKILEWSKSSRDAFDTVLYLNNKYFLDGRDPNSFTGVSWIFGLHDRPWKERAIFGKVRYMAASGLERKCDIKGYVNKVEKMLQVLHS